MDDCDTDAAPEARRRPRRRHRLLLAAAALSVTLGGCAQMPSGTDIFPLVEPRHAVVGDFNGDGIEDVIVGHGNGHQHLTL